MKRTVTKHIVVVSQHGIKLNEIKEKVFDSMNQGKFVRYTKNYDEALKLVPKKAPCLLITSGIVGYAPIQFGEKLIQEARAKNQNVTSVLVTSEKYDKADHVVKTRDAHDGGAAELKEILRNIL